MRTANWVEDHAESSSIFSSLFNLPAPVPGVGAYQKVKVLYLLLYGATEQRFLLYEATLYRFQARILGGGGAVPPPLEL